MKISEKKENLNQIKKVQSYSNYKYYLNDHSGEHKEVCLSFLLKCLQITQSSLKRAIKSAVTNANAKDLRGSFPTRKTAENDLQFVINFIKKFPSYSSHYGASSSKRKYLNPNLNIMKLYREYVMCCEFKKRKNTLLEWKFREVFNTKFNLAFKPKKSDTCSTCDQLDAEKLAVKNDFEATQRVINKKQNHLDLWHKIKKEFNDCVDEAKKPMSKTEVVTFDLQRALEVPSITTSQAFYSRQLWVYNLCVFDEVRKKGHMYIWNESIASRGAEEIFSCIRKHFINFIPRDTENIIAYSDSCPGQNKNRKMTLMLKKLLDSWPYKQLQKIEQRYFVPGHSYNSCDQCFGVIERQKKFSELAYVPKHWVNIISQAKKEEPKYTVVEMNREDFLSCAQLEKIITNRKKSIDGSKINWLKFQKITNMRSNPFDLMVENYSLQSQPQTHISLKKRGESNTFSKAKFTSLYPGPRPIKKEKFDDLQNLLKYIDSQYHEFYNSLTFE